MRAIFSSLTRPQPQPHEARLRTATKLTSSIKSYPSPPTAPSSFDIPLLTCMYKYTLGNIATAVFGLYVDTFAENDVFFNTTTEMFQAFIKNRKFQFAMLQMFPRFSKLAQIQGIEQKYSDFYWSLLNAALTARQNGGVKGSDFFQLLVDAQNEDNPENDKVGKGNKKNIKWTNELACAQAFLFMGAGFATVANNLAAAMYILATEGELQDKVYQEVKDVMGENETISYDDSNKLENAEILKGFVYTLQVLRLYPVQSRLERIAVKDYAVMRSNGKTVIIPKGANIAISAEAVQKDEQYFANPLNFDPERFSVENKGKISPYSYLPFGVGPRNCIGMRFALAETKVLLAHVVRNFVLSPTKTTRFPSRFQERRSASKSIWGSRYDSRQEFEADFV
ncbi:Cytochrome P450 3A11 [Folsomia candida]|uniref:Cytochrome P450 3A11 n=1 Tax=Folsomia candida TaxID=158441 RepID=A0A226DJC0_FOLCA|nr:Cytochrome P450 3A11 [Folsomia candida]